MDSDSLWFPDIGIRRIIVTYISAVRAANCTLLAPAGGAGGARAREPDRGGDGHQEGEQDDGHDG